MRSGDADDLVSDAWIAATLAGLILWMLINYSSAFVASAGTHLDFSGALGSSVRVIFQPLEPDRAWRTSFALSPLIYWAVLIAQIGVVIAIYTMVVQRMFLRGRTALGVRAHVGIAKRNDLSRLVVKTPTVGRITLGRSHRRLLATESQASLAVIGPTGCGKTAGFAIPALLEWQGPIIATSVKEDLLSATVEHRRSKGRVWIFDPTQSTTHTSSHWSPVATCATWAGAIRTAAWLCESAQPKLDSVADGDYWYSQARKVLAPYLFAAAIGEFGMGKVAGWIDRQEQEQVAALLRQTPSESQSLHPALVSVLSIWTKDTKLRDSIFATAENVVASYADPAVQAFTEHSEIDFGKWLSGDNTIYVVASSYEQARLRPVLTVLVQSAIRAAFDLALLHGGSLPQPCLTLLDEAGNTAPLRDLPAYASTARSHNISLVTIWQDLAQIKSVYGDRWRTVLNNHRAKMFGTGIADDATLEYISRMIGDVQHVEQNHSRDLHGGRHSVSEHTSFRRAAPVDLLRRINVNEGLLLYGSELPIHLELRPWWLMKSQT